MNNIFLITGLPRSRTTWLANLFTGKDVFCYHEALRFCTSVRDLAALFESHEESYVGNADTDMLPVMHEICSFFPSPKLVIVERDPDTAIKSFVAFGLHPETKTVERYVRAYHRMLQEIQKNLPCLSVAYEALESEETVRKIWEYLLPGLAFNQKRFWQANEMIVNIHLPKAMARCVPGSLAEQLRDRYIS